MSHPNRPPPFAALVPALDPGEALRPIAGATLLERQLHALAGAGVTHAVLLVDSLPAEMATAIARLRGGRMRIDLVRSLAEAVPRLGGAARVLLLADGCLPDAGLLDAVARAPVPALATLVDGDGLDAHERIDAATRWAGVALLDAARVADTAAMLGEWDPASTLLRRAVQEGAGRLPAGTPPLLAGDAAAMADVERRLLLAARRGRRGWARRRIEGPFSDRLLPLLLERGIAREAIGLVAAGLAIAAGPLALAGWRLLALAALLASGAAMACANQLYALHGEASTGHARQRRARLAGLGLALAAFGVGLFGQDGQWGWLLVALTTALSLGALHWASRLLARLGGTLDLPWLAGPGAMPWVLAPFAVAGWWRAGALALLLYGLASLAAAARRLGEAIGQRWPTGT